MTTPVSTIRNLGPATEKDCARAGITSAEMLRELGADAAYAKLVAAGVRPHFVAYFAMVMGLQGRPWNDCRGAEKTALRARFDAIVSGQASLSDFERELDALGVIPASRSTH